MIIAHELRRSAVAAADEFDAIGGLQELLEMAYEQLEDGTQTPDQRRVRTGLLIACYLQQVRPSFENLKQELKEIRQQIARLSEFEGVRHG